MTDWFENAVTLRRRLHAIPEIGWCEFETTALIVEELDRLGWTVHMGRSHIGLDAVMGRDEKLVERNLARAREAGVPDAMLERMEGFTGCIAEWKTGREGPVTALRFDIDCVGVEETDAPEHKPNREGFASVHKGWMHACGHDGHTAIGLTVARWVAENAGALRGVIRLVFQPAEEGVRGAAAQAASGLLDDVDYILGAHLSLMCGSGEVCANLRNVLATTKLDVTYTGRPAHPTMSPELGRDALACLCTTVTQLRGMAPHGKGMSCVNIGRIEAGEFRNVVPAHGFMQLEVRGATGEINDYVVNQALRLIKGAALGYDVEYAVTKAGEATSLLNDPELVDLVTEVASGVPGVETVSQDRSMGASEDFTMLGARVQAHGGKAAFFIIGADRPGAHHQKNFDFDENALGVGFSVFKGCLENLNGSVG